MNDLDAGWCVPATGTTRQCSDATRIFCGQAYWLVVDSTYVAWTTYSGDVWATRKSGGSPWLVAGAQESINGLSLSPDGYLYWAAAVYTQAQTTGVIARAPLDGGPRQVLASGLNSPTSVVADATAAYWYSPVPGDILKVGLSGGPPMPLVSAPGANGLIAESPYLYWSSSQTGQILRAPTTGGMATPLFSGQFSPSFLTLYGGWLYWSESNLPGDLRRGPLGGGAVEVIAAGLAVPSAISVDSTRVYWLVQGNYPGELRSAPLDGGPSALLLNTAAVGRLAGDPTNLFLSTPTGVWVLAK